MENPRAVYRSPLSIDHSRGRYARRNPLVAHHMDFDRFSKDGVLEPGMVVSVESYIGEVGAADGVKLEEEVLITETGIERLSRYPFNDELLNKEV